MTALPGTTRSWRFLSRTHLRRQECFGLLYAMPCRGPAVPTEPRFVVLSRIWAASAPIPRERLSHSQPGLKTSSAGPEQSCSRSGCDLQADSGNSMPVRHSASSGFRRTEHLFGSKPRVSLTLTNSLRPSLSHACSRSSCHVSSAFTPLGTAGSPRTFQAVYLADSRTAQPGKPLLERSLGCRLLRLREAANSASHEPGN